MINNTTTPIVNEFNKKIRQLYMLRATQHRLQQAYPYETHLDITNSAEHNTNLRLWGNKINASPITVEFNKIIDEITQLKISVTNLLNMKATTEEVKAFSIEHLERKGQQQFTEMTASNGNINTNP